VILYEEKIIDLKNNYVCTHLPYNTLLETDDFLSKINKLRLIIILIRFISPLVCLVLTIFVKEHDKKMVWYGIFLIIITVDLFFHFL